MHGEALVPPIDRGETFAFVTRGRVRVLTNKKLFLYVFAFRELAGRQLQKELTAENLSLVKENLRLNGFLQHMQQSYFYQPGQGSDYGQAPKPVIELSDDDDDEWTDAQASPICDLFLQDHRYLETTHYGTRENNRSGTRRAATWTRWTRRRSVWTWSRLRIAATTRKLQHSRTS